jgi:hypothetical protein
MALMAAHGEIGPMPDCAIHVVSAGNIRDNLMDAAAGKRWASIPAFAKTVTPAGSARLVLDEDDDGELVQIGSRATSRETVSIGMMRRACTADYKIVPIRRKVWELLGLTRKRSPDHAVAEHWIGISTDEASRIKLSFKDWQINRWPLIDQRMSRRDCLVWLRRYDYPTPPKSACIGCPFDNGRWRHMRDHDPEAWAEAVIVDRALRTGIRRIVVKFIFIAHVFLLTKPTCRRPPIMANSISGPSNAKACVASRAAFWRCGNG